MDLFSVLSAVMAKYESKYQELYSKFKADMETNKNLKESVKAEADSKTITNYFDQAKQLLEQFNTEALQTAAAEESRLQAIENEKNQRALTMEQRLLDTNIRLLTMQILNTNNLALIRQHFEGNRENLSVLAMMRDFLTGIHSAPNSDKNYFTGDPEKTDINPSEVPSPDYSGLLSEINQAMVTDLDRIKSIKQQVLTWPHYSEELHTAIIPHNLRREFYGDQSGIFFANSGTGV